MAEYIEREAAIKAIKAVPPGNWSGKRYVEEIKTIPAADVAPVKYGEWYHSTKIYFALGSGIGVGMSIWKCSLCNGGDVEEKRRYCPNCGAKMDREGER